MASTIVLRGITKRFPGVTVVRDLDLEIDAGSFTTLLGPSGCGKTTTLRMIAGLEEPDAGEILINGQPVFSAAKGISVPPYQRNVGLIFQSYALWPHMTVGQNIAFGVEKRLPGDELRKRIAAALQQVDLVGLEGRYPSELSGGQQQRVALARTLVVQPDILLMDEPLSNLDAKLRTHMRAELKHIHDSMDVTVVYVTHDQLEALTLSTKIGVMSEGVVEQYAGPDEIYRYPATVFVAEFVGNPQANLIAGRVLRSGPHVEVAVGDSVESRMALPGDFPQVQEVLLCVRPEDFRLVSRPAGFALKGKVYAVLPTGADLMVHMLVDGVKVVVRGDRTIAAAAGEELWLEVHPTKVNVFDPRTKRLILPGIPAPGSRQRAASA